MTRTKNNGKERRTTAKNIDNGKEQRQWQNKEQRLARRQEQKTNAGVLRFAQNDNLKTKYGHQYKILSC
jgi:hypothetical protein